MSNPIMVSQGRLYELRLDRTAPPERLRWMVRGMNKCNVCDCPGPVYVTLKFGDYYAGCCGFHLGGKPGGRP